MPGFIELLRRNRNYRLAWTGQVVSEIGDHFNNIAVFSLVLATTRSGLVVSAVMLSRAIPAVLAGPLAGVVVDRFDRRAVMIVSDLTRAVVAVAFVLTVHQSRPWLLYLLSGLLMFASPFFSSGRAALLPRVASPDELHTANSLTQTTQWTTTTIGTLVGGFSAARFGYSAAFVLNSLSFAFSAWAISRMRLSGERVQRSDRAMTEADVIRPFREYAEGLRYLRSQPLMLAIAMVGVGWASGGGAAQILFSLFGEVVFDRGPAGIGIIWASAGFGLIVGGAVAHRLGPRLSFTGYKRTIAVCYLLHGASYVLFSQSRQFVVALCWIAMSRAAVGVSSVLNWSLLLRHVDAAFRGRVFATNESLIWATMMLSMLAAGVASQSVDPRVIGAVAGLVSSMTAAYWLLADRAGLLVEPTTPRADPDAVELRTEVRA
jgi:predicted MFS family arabinose efflux permease